MVAEVRGHVADLEPLPWGQGHCRRVLQGRHAHALGCEGAVLCIPAQKICVFERSSDWGAERPCKLSLCAGACSCAGLCACVTDRPKASGSLALAAKAQL